MANRRQSTKRLTKGEIRSEAMRILDHRGVECWIQNNRATPGRKFIGRYGVADISGYVRGTGVRVECEVKADGDTLSTDQKNFLNALSASGGWCFIAQQSEVGHVELINFSHLNK